MLALQKKKKKLFVSQKQRPSMTANERSEEWSQNQFRRKPVLNTSEQVPATTLTAVDKRRAKRVTEDFGFLFILTVH